MEVRSSFSLRAKKEKVEKGRRAAEDGERRERDCDPGRMEKGGGWNREGGTGVRLVPSPLSLLSGWLAACLNFVKEGYCVG